MAHGADPAVDGDTLAARQRYAVERDRRTGADRSFLGETAPDAVLARYLTDPFTPVAERMPIVDDVDVLIVGAGIAGVVTGAQLRRRGVGSVRLVDVAGGVGGTWYWNRYPGVMCDVESYIYLPMLEEMGVVPPRKYAQGEEIRQHVKAIAQAHDLVDDALFHTRVVESRWDEVAARWIVSTDRGDVLRARYLVMAVGFLNLVKLPALPGLETFRGASFHSARWDYGVTGGAPGDDRLTALADKAVGVIGTGASAVQCVPALGASARRLIVFQRTPTAVGPRDDRPTPPDFADGLRPGWQRERMDNFTALLAGQPVERDLVDDAWTHYLGRIVSPTVPPGTPPEQVAAYSEAADLAVMEEHRARIAAVVDDPAVAEVLMPHYRYMCRRPCFHDGYLPTFNRPNVTLVDCPQGVTAVTETGVVANGEHHDLDVLVFATGFEAEVTPLWRRAGHPIIGRGGIELADEWRDGAQTLHGILTRGFPNLFLSPSPAQQGVGSTNHTHIMVTGADHIAETIAKLDAAGVRIADVGAAAQADWVARIEAAFRDRTEYLSSCTPSRITYDGDPTRQNPRNASFGGFGGDYPGWTAILDEWRAAPDFPGLEIER